MTDSYLDTDGERLLPDSEQAPHEYAFCSRCKDNAEFMRDADGDWVSACCGWPPIPVDVEPDDFGDFNLAEAEED